jgi:Glutathione S-transferase, N-terminal domain
VVTPFILHVVQNRLALSSLSWILKEKKAYRQVSLGNLGKLKAASTVALKRGQFHVLVVPSRKGLHFACEKLALNPLCGLCPSANDMMDINPEPAVHSNQLLFVSSLECPFAQRVWIALEEKNIPFHRADYDLRSATGTFSSLSLPRKYSSRMLVILHCVLMPRRSVCSSKKAPVAVST